MKKSLITLSLFTLSMYLFYLFMWQGFYKFQFAQFKKREECFLSKNKIDILFIGSSRVNCSINPKIIDSITELKSYNLGIDGANMYQMNLNLNAYLKTHEKTKIIVLGLDIFSLSGEKKIADPILYFSSRQNTIISSALEDFDYYKPIYSCFPPLELTAFDDNQRLECFKGWAGKKNHATFYKGWICPKMSKNSTKTLVPNSLGSLRFNRDLVKELEHFITTCRNNNIKLLLVEPPYANNYIKGYSNYLKFYEILFQKSNSNSVKIINTNKTYPPEDFQYKDNLHLNAMGSQKYSTEIGNYIRKNIH